MSRSANTTRQPRSIDAMIADGTVSLASNIASYLRKSDLARILGLSERTFERMVASGQFPKPDFHVGSGKRPLPRWRQDTLDAWTARGGVR